MTTINPDGPSHGGGTSPPPGAIVTPDRVLDSAFAFWRSAVLLSAHDLGVFAELAAGASAAEALAIRLSIRQDAVVDLLEALVALGLLERRGPNYRNSPEVSLYLDPTKPTYIGRSLAMAGEGMRAMASLPTRLRVPTPPLPEQRGLAARMWADIAEIQLSPRYLDL